MNPWYRISNEHEVASPALLVYPNRIEQNLERMIQWVGDVEQLRPHVKTHKLPQIVRMKLAKGITKFKVATIAEAEMVAAAGAADVLLAYQPVGPQIGRLLKLIQTFPKTQFSALVDNAVTLTAISEQAERADMRVPLLVDLNIGMNRTGVEPDEQAASLYRHLSTMPGAEAAGLHAYDGHLRDADPIILRVRVSEAFLPVWRLAAQLQTSGYPVPKIVAAGTPTSHLLAKHPSTEVGAGTTVLWDDGQATLEDHGFIHAAVLLTRVVSKPKEDLICIDLGSKSVASEMPQPRVRFLDEPELEIESQSEEHMVLRVTGTKSYQVGDTLYAIPKHICPTVALQSEVVVIENGQATTTWPVVGRARRITI